MKYAVSLRAEITCDIHGYANSIALDSRNDRSSYDYYDMRVVVNTMVGGATEKAVVALAVGGGCPDCLAAESEAAK